MGFELILAVDVEERREYHRQRLKSAANSPGEGASGYQGSKFALLRFAEALMVDHGMEGFLAYTVHPCGVATDLGLGMPERVLFGKSHYILHQKALTFGRRRC